MTQLIRSGPAYPRLEWLLDGLSGRWPEDFDAAAVLDDTFIAQVSVERFVGVMVERSTALAPITLVGIDAEGDEATARFRSRTGDLWVARVHTAQQEPHRIVSAYCQPWVPDYLTARLPDVFSPSAASVETDGREVQSDAPVASSPTLIVFSGVPGSGKSTVAARVGAALWVPVFALDWLLGALSPFGLRHHGELMQIGEELLVTLAYRQLQAGGSAIIDATVESPSTRQRLESLSTSFGAEFRAVVCVCSDLELHRRRVEQRRRNIPGWQDAGNWANVQQRRAVFPSWPGSVEIDTTQPLDRCVEGVLASVARSQHGS